MKINKIGKYKLFKIIGEGSFAQVRCKFKLIIK